ncbi:IS66 family insertion sequence element accessory protein TnpB [Bradyrhizobium liaoningense]
MPVLMSVLMHGTSVPRVVKSTRESRSSRPPKRGGVVVPLSIKLLIYDRSGFWMLLKRLEADRFHWPRSQEAVLTLTTEELHWLLDGINIAAVRRHPVRQYHSVG